MKHWSTVILSVLLVGFAAYSGYLSMENSSLKRQLANMSLAPEPVRERSAQGAIEVAVSEEDAEQPIIEGRRRPVGEDGEPLTREDIMERRREQRNQGIERMLAALDDPEMRLDMIERNMGRIDRAYEDLFKRLKLPPEELDALKTLMAEQGLLRMEGQLRASLAEEGDRDAVREDYKAQREQLTEDIYALLGEDKAAQFKYFNNTLEYRGDVDDIERTLSFTDTPMTVRQSEGLVKAFASVDKNFEYSYDLEQMRRGGDRDQITQEVVDTYYQEREIYDTMILENASKVLNDQQLAALAAQQISDREREQREMQYQLDNPDTGGRGGFSGGFRGGGGRGGSSGGGFRGGGGGGGRGGR